MNDKILFSDLEEIYKSDIDWERFRDKTVLISGAYGMLASYVTYMLIYLNEYKSINVKILALVRSEDKFKKCFSKFSDRDYITVSTQTLNEPLSFDEKIDYIIHAASFASPNYYGVCPVDVIEPNTLGTYNLLQLSKEKAVSGFLMFSSSDVYGICDGVEAIDEDCHGSMDTLDIHNCYSESKRLAETMCKAFSVQYGVPAKMARIWHTYAPTMDIEKDPRVFASFMKNVVNKEDIVMKSNGLAKRSFCYITDAVIAYFKILLDGKSGEAYNVCNSREWHSVAELAELIVKVNPELSLKVIKTVRSADEKYVESTVAGYIPPSSEKIHNELGWEPKISCSIGFKRVYDYITG